MPVMANPMAIAVTEPAEKFRLLNTRNGSSGSLRLNRCQPTKATSSTSPAAISSKTVTEPKALPQL